MKVTAPWSPTQPASHLPRVSNGGFQPLVPNARGLGWWDHSRALLALMHIFHFLEGTVTQINPLKKSRWLLLLTVN